MSDHHITDDVTATVRRLLGEVLRDDTSVAQAMANPEHNLFDLGLDSLRAFVLLDSLADRGITVDFLSFTEEPTCAFIRRHIVGGANE